MDARAEEAVRAADPEQVQSNIQGFAGLGAAAINLAIIVSFWGQWRVVLFQVGMGLGLTLFNVVLLEWSRKSASRAVVEAARMGVNALCVCVAGIVTEWAVLSWAFVPFNMLFYFGLDRWVRPRMALYLAGIDVVALSTGASPSMALAFSLVG
ncbi:MAG TPA: hypothetical protein VF697_41870, partial [Archangium sp.]